MDIFDSCLLFLFLCAIKKEKKVYMGGKHMKIKRLLKNLSVSGLLASFALCMTTLAANSECFFVFHQPELPEDLKKYRKF